jgi:aminopeptidase-like protein
VSADHLEEESMRMNNPFTGEAMHTLMSELYPICRSITGEGVRQTLHILQRHIPLVVHEVPTGTPVFDWTVPKEWNIRDAYIKNARGDRVIDFQKSNLHVVSYSVPVKKKVSLGELRQHLFSLPDRPDWIPYRTSYYHETWGFCLSHRQLEALPEGEYEVCVDASLKDGSLTYGEYVIPGELNDEVLVSCHICHPSLCNDNLSGIAVATFLAAQLAQDPKPRHTYRFLFIPGTIGSIIWLARNEERVQRIKHGLVVTCVGDGGSFTYKKSRRGNAEIDRATLHVLKQLQYPYVSQDFFPYGYDERQYCSPGFNLPVGCLMRSPHGSFPEYHTSADNLDFVRPENLSSSLDAYRQVVEVLEGIDYYLNLNPKCEPQLGRRGLYSTVGADPHHKLDQMALLWVLNLSDGAHSLLDISEAANLPFREIKRAADALEHCELLRKCAAGSPAPTGS